MTRQAFQSRIAEHLGQLGFKPNSYIWAAKPARLVLIVNGAFKEVPIKASMSRERLAYQLGRIEGWAEMLGLAAMRDESINWQGGMAPSERNRLARQAMANKAA
jgi:hypothetical protein